MKVNIGLIGFGRIGKLHAEHLIHRVPEANLVAIAEIKERLSGAKDFAKGLGMVKTTQDYRELLNDPSIKAVVICSPTNTHFEVIMNAAKAGKHIFCEKPIDYDLSRIDRCIREVKRSGVKFQVGFNRRFDPNYAHVKKSMLEGKIGVPQLIHITSRDKAPPSLSYIKSSGGIFMDMTIHDFDMARFLIGSEVEEIFACGSVLIDSDIGEAGDIDTAIVVLRFTNGAIGTISNSRKAAYGYDQRVEVFGSKGMIDTKNHTLTRTVISDIKGIHTPNPLNFFIDRYTESYIVEMRAFIDSIINDRQTLVSGIDGKIAVVMALAAQKSYEEKRIVKLSEISKERIDHA